MISKISYFGRYAAAMLAVALFLSSFFSPAAAHRIPSAEKQAAAQVKTALRLLPKFQRAVAETYRTTGKVPRNRTEAGMSALGTDTATDYVGSVNIVDGSIIVLFANYADPLIVGRQIAFTPYESPDLTIVWRCPGAPEPVGLQFLGTSGGGTSSTFVDSTIPESLYPQPCLLKTQVGDPIQTIRKQIREPFENVEHLQDLVELFGAQLGEANGDASAPIPPRNRGGIGISSSATDTSGNYFSSIDIVDGTIVVTYGNGAIPAISDQWLGFTPYETPDGTIVWRCGSAPAPAGASLMGSASGSITAPYLGNSPRMLRRYLPPECR